jgi:hypothetical protein
MAAPLDDPLALALGHVVAQQRSGARPAGASNAEAARPEHGRVSEPRPHSGRGRARTVSEYPAAAERLALESAALALLVRAFAPVVHRLPVEALAGALSASDPTVAAAALAATVATDLSARAAATPLVRAWLESARRKRELLEEAGGGLTAAQVAHVRGITRQAVERARAEQRLLAVPASAVASALAATSGTPTEATATTPEGATTNDWLYPAAQFGADGHPLPGLVPVLRAFQTSHVVGPWTQLSELLAPDPELGGRSILALLREQGEAAVPAAVAALRQVGTMGA